MIGVEVKEGYSNQEIAQRLIENGLLVLTAGSVMRLLPPLVIISVISLFYQSFRSNAIVNMAMMGMLAGVAAVICDVVYTMARSVLKEKRLLPLLVLLGSFAAVRYLHVNIMVIILACGGIGACDVLYRGRREERA